MSKPIRWPRRLAVWMNALGDAWNEGRSTVVFVDGIAVAPSLWSREYEATGDPEKATDAVVAFAKSIGVEPGK